MNSPQQPTSECFHILSQINDYIDGELSPELCHELENHMAQGHDSSSVLDTLNKTIYLVHSLNQEPPKLPVAVEERLFAVLDLQDFLDDQGPTEKGQ